MTKCGSPHQTADKMTKQLGHAAKTLRLSDKTARLFFVKSGRLQQKGCLTLLREATFSLFNMVVDPIPKLRFVLCAIRDTNEHIGQLILLQLELISIPFE